LKTTRTIYHSSSISFIYELNSSIKLNLPSLNWSSSRLEWSSSSLE